MPITIACQEDIIVNLTGCLNSTLLKTGICIWEQLQSKSIDKLKSLHPSTQNNEFLLALQFTNSVISQFIAGCKVINIDTNIQQAQQTILIKYAKTIIEQSVEIRLELLNYAKQQSCQPSLELWVYELINSLSNISGLMQSIQRDN